MENTHTYDPLLEMLDRPAFFVENGVISQVNQAARHRMVVAGDPIEKYLDRDLEAYNAFRGECLCLTLNIEGIPCNADVLDMQGKHLFLPQVQPTPELQALSLAAQQLRLPINSVYLAAENITDAQTAAQINRSLNQLHRLVCNMADAHRYCEQSAFQGETTDLNQFFSEVMEKASALVSRADVNLTFTALPQNVIGLADRQMLERAILNLISNAVKFSPKRGTVETKLTCKGHMLYFTVRDSGRGMEADLRSSVFSRYLRTPGIEDGSYGLGLGLSLVRSAATTHGGTVLIDHPEGGGTRVTMTLDLHPPESNMLRASFSIPTVDYAGGHDHALLELSDILPPSVY